MVWKTNFDRVLEDQIIIPVATNHKRKEENARPAVVKGTRSRSSPVKEEVPANSQSPPERPTLDQILDTPPSDPFFAPDDPGLLAAPITQIVSEMNVMSQTLGLIVQRMTLLEDKVRKLEISSSPSANES